MGRSFGEGSTGSLAQLPRAPRPRTGLNSRIADQDSLNCVRCDSPLTFVGERDFHEGSRGWGFFLGDLGELFVNREKVEMYVCEACGHLEFFVPD